MAILPKRAGAVPQRERRVPRRRTENPKGEEGHWVDWHKNIHNSFQAVVEQRSTQSFFFLVSLDVYHFHHRSPIISPVQLLLLEIRGKKYFIN